MVFNTKSEHMMKKVSSVGRMFLEFGFLKYNNKKEKERSGLGICEQRVPLEVPLEVKAIVLASREDGRQLRHLVEPRSLSKRGSPARLIQSSFLCNFLQYPIICIQAAPRRCPLQEISNLKEACPTDH